MNDNETALTNPEDRTLTAAEFEHLSGVLSEFNGFRCKEIIDSGGKPIITSHRCVRGAITASNWHQSSAQD